MALSFFSRLSVRAATASTPSSFGSSLVGYGMASSSLNRNLTPLWMSDNTKAFIATKSKQSKRSSGAQPSEDSKLTTVVLMEDIPRGMKGEIIKVSRGYARNYLLPLGKAVRATEQNIKQHSQEITVQYSLLSIALF